MIFSIIHENGIYDFIIISYRKYAHAAHPQ